jgi:3-phytase
VSRGMSLSLGLLAGCAFDPAPEDLPPDDGTATVTARGETSLADGDPDDPAIWVDPDDPSRTLVFGTDKEHGLRAYDLAGATVQDLPDGRMNSVDLREVTLGGRAVTLVTTGNRSDDTVVFYELAGGALTRLGAIDAGLTIYGHCMGVDPDSGEPWIFLDDKQGTVVQWQLGLVGDAITATEVRRLDVGGQVENCVVDDSAPWLYIGEEDVGVWRYGARPRDGEDRLPLALVGTGEMLVADVEGLAIYDAGRGEGWIVASSQGDNAYAVFDRRPPHPFRGRFRIVAGALDAASESDGIEVTSAPLPGYEGGLFVAHDTADEGFTGNFKMVAWDDIVVALAL